MTQLRRAKSDLKKESEGVWVPHPLGFSFRIARLGNPAFKAATTAALTPELVQQARLDPTIMAKQAEKVTPRLLAEFVLKDWKNVEDAKGKPIKYTPKEGEKILRDPAYRDIYDFIEAAATNAELFIAAFEDSSEKN